MKCHVLHQVASVVLVAAAAGPFCLASGCLITWAPVVLTLYIQELTEWAAVEEAECEFW